MHGLGELGNSSPAPKEGYISLLTTMLRRTSPRSRSPSTIVGSSRFFRSDKDYTRDYMRCDSRESRVYFSSLCMGVQEPVVPIVWEPPATLSGKYRVRFYAIVYNLSASVEPQSAPSASKRFRAIPPGHFLQVRFRRNVRSMEAHRCAPLKLCIVHF